MTKSEFSDLLNNSSEFRKIADCDDGTQWFTGVLNDEIWDCHIPGNWIFPAHQFSGSIDGKKITVDIK